MCCICLRFSLLEVVSSWELQGCNGCGVAWGGCLLTNIVTCIISHRYMLFPTFHKALLVKQKKGGGVEFDMSLLHARANAFLLYQLDGKDTVWNLRIAPPQDGRVLHGIGILETSPQTVDAVPSAVIEYLNVVSCFMMCVVGLGICVWTVQAGGL